MSEDKIADALLAHLREFTTDLPIMYPGFSNAPAGPYIRADLFPAPAENAALTRWVLHTGTMQIGIFEKQGQFIIEPMAEAARLAAHYRDQTIERDGVAVKIIRPPSVRGAVYSDGWMQIPVEVRWTCWVRH